METMTSCQRSYQQDIESDQPRDSGQELKGRVRVHLHAERERCVDELSADYRVCEEMRVQIAHTCSGRSKCKGGHRKFHHTVDEWKTANICTGRRQDEPVKVIQLEALVAERERLPKSVARLKHACMVDDAEDERDEETFLDACFFLHRTAIIGSSPLRRRTERDVRQNSYGRRNRVVAEGDAIHVLNSTVPLKTARLRVVRTSSPVVWVIVAGGQGPRPKLRCSQTVVSRGSSKKSFFALDA